MFPSPHNSKPSRVSAQGRPGAGLRAAGAARAHPRSREAGPGPPLSSGAPGALRSLAQGLGNNRRGTRRGQVHTPENT